VRVPLSRSARMRLTVSPARCTRTLRVKVQLRR
jgi:hypothetical protein